jgi:hypothetical protein
MRTDPDLREIDAEIGRIEAHTTSSDTRDRLHGDLVLLRHRRAELEATKHYVTPNPFDRDARDDLLRRAETQIQALELRLRAAEKVD